MAQVSNWMYVDFFTVQQVAALWCRYDPKSISPIPMRQPSEFVAAKQMLMGGIISEELPASHEYNPNHIIGDFSQSIVSRDNLTAFARSKDVFPPFLFDTLAAKDLPTDEGDKKTPDKNRGGRPTEWDWDAFICEIIRKANSPDGLPEKQADLVRDMLEWFMHTYKKEPAESSVKSRISNIYKYLRKVKNSKR